MTDQVANAIKVDVSGGYDAAATAITLTTGEGAELPNPSGDEYNLVWWDSTLYPDPADDPNFEIIRATGLSGDVLTVSRNQESTGASTKNTASSEYKMLMGVTAKTITDLQAEFSDAVTDSDFTADEGFLRKTGAGAYEAIKSNMGAAVAPTVNEDSGDGYMVASRWLDTTADKEYICLDATLAAAVWIETTKQGGSPGGADTQVQFNDGGAFGADASLVWDKANDRLSLPEIRALDASGLKLYDDGGSGIFVQDGGSVGIGTAAPSKIFEISDGSNIRVNFDITQEAGGKTEFHMYDDNGGNKTSLLSSKLWNTASLYTQLNNFEFWVASWKKATLNATKFAFVSGMAVDVQQLNAIDANGLKLYDDGGNGIFIEDGGDVHTSGNLYIEEESKIIGSDTANDTSIWFHGGNRLILTGGEGREGMEIGRDYNLGLTVVDFNHQRSDKVDVLMRSALDTIGPDTFAFLFDSSTGNLGLGTVTDSTDPGTLPKARLHVRGNGTTAALLDNGHVGIGVAVPSRPLSVSGDGIHFTPQLAVPTTATEGDAYFDSVTHKLKVYNGTIWEDCN